MLSFIIDKIHCNTTIQQGRISGGGGRGRSWGQNLPFFPKKFLIHGKLPKLCSELCLTEAPTPRIFLDRDPPYGPLFSKILDLN